MFLFEIYSKPMAQKQTRFANGHCYDPSLKDRQAIQWQSKPYAPDTPLTSPVSMDLTFYLPIPKSTSAIQRRQMINQILHHTKKPDVDNCAYLITNALKGIFYQDDSQIIDLMIHKRYGETPKTVVKITAIEEIAKTKGVPCP